MVANVETELVSQYWFTCLHDIFYLFIFHVYMIFFMLYPKLPLYLNNVEVLVL